ncbi:hypothetical protein HMPREF1544_08434 [Mucor circinelloides 1006PhL]|uniref:Major facilitator superfamily (MFS) profile domain-containing protein n=1 Tax=Mucor circinelloides f. circinelloides (strain 1006PhL) TaxID=1220926 RepID=S2J3S5_MUCC1|nr:hypothetical protein HMPREF1544_08434 [Mucor circinelloides 1006PhL]
MEQDKFSHFEHIENHATIQDKRLVKNDTSMSDSTYLSTSSSATNVAVQEKEGIIVIEEKTSTAAWLETLVCIGVSTSCAFMWTTGASAPNVMSQWMNVSLSQINWLSNASAICNTVFSLFTAWAYERIGIKASIILCAVFNTVGCWIRCIAIVLPVEKRYPLVMVGQFIASIGGPLIYNVAAKFVAVWFAPKDRGIANTVLSVQAGMALAPLLLPMLAPTIKDVPKMLIIVAGISTVFTIPTFFIPSKPKVPPSTTATLERTPFWEGVWEVITNMQFWWIAIITSVSMGMVFSVSVLIIEAISPFGYTEQQAGLCAALIVFSGCFGGGMTGYWLGKSSQHFMLIKMFTPMVVFSYVIFIFLLRPDAFSVVIIACIINGFCSYALFPVYLEVASEITYPVSESVSSCVLWTLCSLTMVVFSLVIDALRAGPDASPPNNMNTSMMVVAGIMFVGNLPCLWIKGDLKRSQVDNENSKKLAPVA